VSSAKITRKKVKNLDGIFVEVTPGEFRKEATVFMLQLIRGRLSLPDIEAHIVKPIKREMTLRNSAWRRTNELPYVRRKRRPAYLYLCGMNSIGIMRVLILAGTP